MYVVVNSGPRTLNNGKQMTNYCVKHMGHIKETHLKVGQNHFSIHVAIAAFGGHGNDWLKAILLPLALVASRLTEGH